MSASAGSIGYGFVLSHCATSSGSYTPIIEITELKPGKKTAGKIDIARNDSPDLYGETFSGWNKEGDWEAKCIYEPGKRAVLDALFGVQGFWKFIRPNGTSTSAFAGFLSELGDEVPLKEFMTSDFKITVNGKVTFTS